MAVLAAWQAVSSAGLVSPDRLPPPTQVWSTAVALVTHPTAAYGSLQGNLAASLERVAAGFAFGAAAALILAVAAGLSRAGENGIDPLLQMLRTLPLFGLIPVFIVWFGIGELPKILLIAIGSAIPLYLNTFSGIRNVDARLGELGQVLGLRRRRAASATSCCRGRCRRCSSACGRAWPWPGWRWWWPSSSTPMPGWAS